MKPNRTEKKVYQDKETDFVPVVVWEKLAEICNEYLGKGKQVCIAGELLESVGVKVEKATLLLLPKPAQGSEWKEVVLWDSTEQGKDQFQNLRMAVLAMIQTESYLKAQKDGSMSASTAQRLMQAFVSLSCANPAQSSGPSQKRSLKRSEAAL